MDKFVWISEYFVEIKYGYGDKFCENKFWHWNTQIDFAKNKLTNVKNTHEENFEGFQNTRVVWLTGNTWADFYM